MYHMLAFAAVFGILFFSFQGTAKFHLLLSKPFKFRYRILYGSGKMTERSPNEMIPRR